MMKNTVLLNQKNLAQLGNCIPAPTYNRNSHKIGMVHIGVGGFHRAHQAFYTHKLQEIYNAPEWSICGIGLLKGDQKIHEFLKSKTVFTCLSLSILMVK